MGIFAVAFSYIASVIGAGFASGQEVISFFVKYGKWSILGLLISCLIFGLFAFCVCDDCRKHKINGYEEYLGFIFPPLLKEFFKILTLVFSLICFCTMASATGEMCSTLFKLHPLTGNILICCITLLFLISGNLKILKYNALFGGIIIMGVISCCLYIIGYREHQTFLNSTKIIVSAVSYAGYNTLSTGVVLVKMQSFIKNRTDAVLLGIVTGFSVFVMLFLMWAILGIYYGKVDLGQIPMLTMAIRQNKVVAVIYAVMLFLSILTTALSSAVGVTEMSDKRFSVPVMTVCALSLAGAGFANLVNIAYRICGTISIGMFFYIIAKKIKNRAN